MDVNQPRVASQRATLGSHPKNISPTLQGLHQSLAASAHDSTLAGLMSHHIATQRSVSAMQRWAGLSESFQDSKQTSQRFGRGRKT
jgi:hypothetical protein